MFDTWICSLHVLLHANEVSWSMLRLVQGQPFIRGPWTFSLFTPGDSRLSPLRVMKCESLKSQLKCSEPKSELSMPTFMPRCGEVIPVIFGPCWFLAKFATLSSKLRCKFIRGLGPLACLPQETPDSASLPAAKSTLPNQSYLLNDMTWDHVWHMNMLVTRTSTCWWGQLINAEIGSGSAIH
jgi:hypothetical protein